VPEEKQHASVRCENMHRTEGAHGHMTNEAHGGNKGGASAVFRNERAIRQNGHTLRSSSKKGAMEETLNSQFSKSIRRMENSATGEGNES
jgi:hypothetical protein